MFSVSSAKSYFGPLFTVQFQFNNLFIRNSIAVIVLKISALWFSFPTLVPIKMMDGYLLCYTRTRIEVIEILTSSKITNLLFLANELLLEKGGRRLSFFL